MSDVIKQPAALVLRDREAFSRALAKAMRACLGEDYVREPFAFWMAVAGDVADQLATQAPPAAAVPTDFAEWLAREMPAGTVIGDPHWWANLIARRYAQFAAYSAPVAAPALSSVLDEYERQTKALPCQHEIPERGCSTYNWRMSVIRDLRAMLNAAMAERSESANG